MSGIVNRSAVAWAVAISCLLTVISLRVAPSMYGDAGSGMLQWRTLAAGGPYNTVIEPDPADISKDLARPIFVWTPGQYIAPGLFMLLGANEGTAFALVSGVCLLTALLGWISLMRYFGFSAGLTLLATVFLSTFRYSTLPFGIYNGGEVLLQAATPWLILAGVRIPFWSVARAALAAFTAVSLAFLIKITGLFAAGAALTAGAYAAFVRTKRLLPGVLAVLGGAVAGVVFLYWFYFSRFPGESVGLQLTWDLGELAFGLTAPWGSGISWSDALAWVLLKPGSKLVPDSAMAWFPIPVFAALGLVFLHAWRRREQEDGELLRMTLGVYLVYTAALTAMRLAGFVISLEDRHYRMPGTLIFICILQAAQKKGGAIQRAVLALSLIMSVYGVLSFVSRARSTKASEVDSYSGTRQVLVSMDAVNYARAGLAREGRDALVVVPSPAVASVFPNETRILPITVDFQSVAMLAGRQYQGHVSGHLFVLLQTRLDGTPRGEALLGSFRDYSPGSWERRVFGETTVLSQKVN